MSTSNPLLDQVDQDRADKDSSAFETEPMGYADRKESVEEDPNVATIFSCFVNLSNTILGSGLLGLPYGTAHEQSYITNMH